MIITISEVSGMEPLFSAMLCFMSAESLTRSELEFSRLRMRISSPIRTCKAFY